MPGSVIVSSARTPIGKTSGALAGFTAMDLGGFAIKEALKRAGIGGDQVDYVIMGQVLQAGQGQIPARRAAVRGGAPMRVPAMTLNKVCLSGINALYAADQMINAGDAEVVIAGGMESMTKAPYLLPGARAGYRMGNAELIDSMIHDGLWCAFDAVHMGAGTEKYTAQYSISRQAQDELAAASHERAAAAIKDGRVNDEITPVEVPQRKGDPIMVENDEGVRPGTTAESLGNLRPVAHAPAGQRHQAGPVEGRQAGRRHRPVRDQRGLRRRGDRLHGRPRHLRRHRQRQRRGGRPPPPPRRLGRPPRGCAGQQTA